MQCYSGAICNAGNALRHKSYKQSPISDGKCAERRLFNVFLMQLSSAHLVAALKQLLPLHVLSVSAVEAFSRGIAKLKAKLERLCYRIEGTRAVFYPAINNYES